jgi:hypothetical protein
MDISLFNIEARSSLKAAQRRSLKSFVTVAAWPHHHYALLENAKQCRTGSSISPFAIGLQLSSSWHLSLPQGQSTFCSEVSILCVDWLASSHHPSKQIRIFVGMISKGISGVVSMPGLG